MDKHDELRGRVLTCLKDGKRKSLEEITRTYNRFYPPNAIKRVIGIKMSEVRMNELLKQLVDSGSVSSELMSFTDHPLPDALMHYSITTKGLHVVYKKHT